MAEKFSVNKNRNWVWFLMMSFLNDPHDYWQNVSTSPQKKGMSSNNLNKLVNKIKF